MTYLRSSLPLLSVGKKLNEQDPWVMMTVRSLLPDGRMSPRCFNRSGRSNCGIESFYPTRLNLINIFFPFNIRKIFTLFSEYFFFNLICSCLYPSKGPHSFRKSLSASIISVFSTFLPRQTSVGQQVEGTSHSLLRS